MLHGVRGSWIGILFGLIAPLAQAQIGVPARLPGLPGTGLGGELGAPTELTEGFSRLQSGLQADTDAATRLRRVHITELIRRYPRILERDPHGNAIVRAELAVVSPSDEALERAQAAGFRSLREQTLGALGLRIIILGAPAGMATAQALERLRALDPGGTYDFNHLYSESGPEAPAGTVAAPSRAPAGAQPATSAGSSAQDVSDAPAVRVGLMDSGIETGHPVFRDVPVHAHGCGGVAVPAVHGTEVASLLVGRSENFSGAAPGAVLYAADVYCGAPTGGAMDGLLGAFEWLVQEHVPVINVSLVGPPNALLARVVRAVLAQGYIIVAAVGNDGPAAPPLYPAAYPGVIGVTGVDARRRVLIEAGRGSQVRFAAPGADMSAAVPPRAFALVRGTSFAAPIVAGLLAPALRMPDAVQAQQAIEALERGALDLGARGVDPVYGHGLVGAQLRPDPTLARAR